jgi:Holliday junction resolvasome RuvABC DNA-binding subunit
MATVVVAPAVGGDDVDEHVVARDALVELGYSIADAERALAGTDRDASPEERVRQALRRAA